MTELDLPYIPCCECNHPATKFLEKSAPYDPYCPVHYEEAGFQPCPTCDRIVTPDDLRTLQTAPQTRLDPAEYDTRCCYCAPDDEPEEDPDRWRDDDDGP